MRRPGVRIIARTNESFTLRFGDATTAYRIETVLVGSEDSAQVCFTDLLCSNRACYSRSPTAMSQPLTLIKLGRWFWMATLLETTSFGFV